MRILDKSEAVEWLNDSGFSEAFPDNLLSREDVIYPAVEVNGSLCLFPVQLMNKCNVIHVAIPKEARGQAAVDAGKKCVEWLLDKYPVPLITTSPAWNRAGQRYSVLCGGKRLFKKEKYICYQFGV